MEGWRVIRAARSADVFNLPKRNPVLTLGNPKDSIDASVVRESPLLSHVRLRVLFFLFHLQQNNRFLNQGTALGVCVPHRDYSSTIVIVVISIHRLACDYYQILTSSIVC